MPRLTRDDGVEIHYVEEGSGPLVVLGSYWSMHPSAFGPITQELAGDHRVVHYHDRGTGESTRVGPYDLDTSAADLEGLIDHLGEPAVIAGTADATSRAVRIAARRPDLVRAVVGVGGAPIGRSAFEQSESLVSSETVVRALLQQVETDYRGALRSLLTVTNAQMSEDELRERVNRQIEHSPVEGAAPRLRAWAHDDPLEYGLAAGDRLWVAVSEHLAGGWFPAGAEMAAMVAKLLPEAQIVEIADGWMSRPDETARVVRGITASPRSEAGENRISA